MLVTELYEHLLQIDDPNNNLKTLLIDGKWGSGKTFEITKFLRERKKQSSIYISLFGIESVDDIVIRLSEFLDSKYVINIGGHYAIVQSTKQEDYNGCIIVFDDIERKKESLSFVSLYGIVESLKLLGFKIICVSNLRNQTYGDGYGVFVEKTFDAIFRVDGDIKSFNNVVDNVDKTIEFEQALLTNLDDNWRTVIRASKKYKDLFKEAEDRSIYDLLSIMNITATDLFRCCCLADKCFFTPCEVKPTFKSDQDFEKFIYEEEKKKFGEYAANHLFVLFRNPDEKSREKETLRDCVEKLLTLLNDYDYDSFFENYVSPELIFAKEEEGSLLDKEVFYLDDKGQKEYKDTFFKNLDSFDFSQKYQEEILKKIVSNFLSSLTRKEKKSLIDQIVKTVPTDRASSFVASLTIFKRKEKKVEEFANELLKEFEKRRAKENDLTFDSLFKQKEYDKMTSFLYNNKYVNSFYKDSILDHLSKLHFCLPDLSKEIDYSSWSFCHEMAKYVANSKYQEMFVFELKKQCEKKPKSRVVRDKCNALVFYNFGLDQNYFDK